MFGVVFTFHVKLSRSLVGSPLPFHNSAVCGRTIKCIYRVFSLFGNYLKLSMAWLQVEIN